MIILLKNTKENKMFHFIEKCFFVCSTFLTCLNSLICVSMVNKECKVRPGIVNVNSNEPVFYLFSTVSSKCSGSCNSVNYPYAKICIPDVVKNLNVKVFNLM